MMLRVSAIAGSVIILAGFMPEARSQTIDWSETNIFATVQWIVPQNEFGTYWKNGPAAGLHAEVPFVQPLALTAMAVLSRHEVEETPRKSEIPALFLFQTGGGLALPLALNDSFDAGISVMLVNNMFILTGPNVRPGLENSLESEFGFSFTVFFTLRAGSFPLVRILTSYQPILVGLDPVAIVSGGIAVGL